MNSFKTLTGSSCRLRPNHNWKRPHRHDLEGRPARLGGTPSFPYAYERMGPGKARDVRKE